MSKKKKGGKKKAGGDQEGSDPVEDFKFEYKKMKKLLDLKKPQVKQMEDLVDEENLDDGELIEVKLIYLNLNHFYQLYLYDDILPEGIRAIMQCLLNVNYPYLKDIRIWKCQAKNEGARMVCEFLKINSQHKTPVAQCDLMGNFITELGCEFFG